MFDSAIRRALVYASLFAVLCQGTAQASNFVGFGDSLTTGFSIETCEPRLHDPTARHGCLENPPDSPAWPYPELIARALGLPYDPVDRVGIWGWTAGPPLDGEGMPQTSQTARFMLDPDGTGLLTSQNDSVRQANLLVTGSLGINDIHHDFRSIVKEWLKLYYNYGTRGVGTHVDQHIQRLNPYLDNVFSALRAARNQGAFVIVTLYYNPYDNPRKECQTFREITDVMVSKVNAALKIRAKQDGFAVADWSQPFRGRGAGPGGQNWVFGTECSVDGAGDAFIHDRGDQKSKDRQKRAQVVTDPHPQDSGTRAMADTVRKAFPGNFHTVNGIDHGFLRTPRAGSPPDNVTAFTAHSHGAKYAAIFLCRGPGGRSDRPCKDHPNHPQACVAASSVGTYVSCTFPTDEPAHGVSATPPDAGAADCQQTAYQESSWASFSDGHGICSHDMNQTQRPAATPGSAG